MKHVGLAAVLVFAVSSQRFDSDSDLLSRVFAPRAITAAAAEYIGGASNGPTRRTVAQAKRVALKRRRQQAHRMRCRGRGAK